MGWPASRQVVTCLLGIVISSGWMVDVKVMELEAITVVDDDHGNYK